MTLAQPSEHIHHRFMPQTLTRGKHTHYLQNTSIRDTSHHTLGNRHIGDTCQILLQEDHFVTPSGTHTSEILYILSSTRNTYSLPTQQTHQRYIYSSNRITSSQTRQHIHQRYHASTPLRRHSHHLHNSLRETNIVTYSGTTSNIRTSLHSYTTRTPSHTRNIDLMDTDILYTDS